MTTQVLFNQFAYTDRLKSGGFSDEQARASAEALEAALSDSVATKTDIVDLKHEIVSVETRLNAKIDALNVKMDNGFLQIRLEIASANNAMLVKTGSMLVIIVTLSLGIARYFGIIH
ncbi:MAG TPA: hypothetical protein VEK34_14425 [Methylocella sp.]|nr:hypothetical protein [Methylocella sp.]